MQVKTLRYEGAKARQKIYSTKRKVNAMSNLPTKPKKLSPTQLAKWLRTLPETMNLWELCDNGYTVQQANFALAHYAATKRAAIKLNEDLRAVDPVLTASAESDAGENMRAELRDPSTLGHWDHYFHHLTGAAGCHWEMAGRNVNDELGRVIY